MLRPQASLLAHLPERCPLPLEPFPRTVRADISGRSVLLFLLFLRSAATGADGRCCTASLELVVVLLNSEGSGQQAFKCFRIQRQFGPGRRHEVGGGSQTGLRLIVVQLRPLITTKTGVRERPQVSNFGPGKTGFERLRLSYRSSSNLTSEDPRRGCRFPFWTPFWEAVHERTLTKGG